MSDPTGLGRPTRAEAKDATPSRPTVVESDGRSRPTRAESQSSGAAGRATTSEAGASGTTSRLRYAPPAALLERYSYERDLQPGSQAAVILCRDRSSGEQVAIKLYLGDGVIDPAVFTALVDGDARHVVPSRLEHGDGEQWEVMEYFPLGSLHDLTQDRPEQPAVRFSERQIREFVVEMTSALEFIHSRDIVHRDLKPANVLVRRLAPLDVVLGDFGVSIRTAATAAATVRGTWAYAPPEASYGEVSARSDWWPLGIMVFEMLQGHHPLADPGTGLLPNDQRVRHAIGSGEISVEAVSDERWRLLLSGLLTHDADSRWGSREVRQWIDGKSPAVERARPVKRTLQPFVFADKPYTDPATLTEAMTSNWEAAAQKLSARGGTEELRTFLRDSGVDAEVVGHIDSRSSQSFTLLAMQDAFTSTRPLSFRGRALTGEQLESVAASAQRGDSAAAAWITELRKAGILGEASRYAVDASALAVAHERLTRWWEEIARWESSLPGGPAASQLPALRRVWEGQLLVAALDAGAGERLRTAAAVAARARGDVPRWANELRNRAQQVNPKESAETGTAVVAASLLEIAREEEKQHRRAQDAASEAERRAAADAERRRVREARGALVTARRRRAGREFWTRLWLVGGYALGAGILDTYLAGGANSWSWDAFTASALTAGIASLALSFGVFLWETFADRVRLIGRRSIFFAAAIISIALLWARLVGGGLITPVGPQWWTIPPLVFAGFFALAVVLSAVVGRRATDAAAIADDSSWRQVQASRGLRRLAGWTVPFVVIAGLITLGAGAALGFTLMGQAIPDLLASGGPEWLYETAVRMDDVLPDAPVATGSVDRMLLYAAVLTYGVIVLRLYRDIASRSRGLAAALLVIAMVASLAVALFSPWEIVLAGFMGVTGAIGIVVIAVIGWIVLSVFS